METPGDGTNCTFLWQDTFEDANDTAIESNHVESPSQKSRSLTEQLSSPGADTTKDTAKDIPPLPPRKESNGEVDHIDQAENDTRPPKSPLLTSHRLSNSSSLDNVALEEDGTKEEPEGTTH